MKKIFAILTLLLAFSISANAQETAPNPNKAANADLAKLTQFIPLGETSKKNLVDAFYNKNKALTQQLTAEDKIIVKTQIENELSSNLSPEQLQKLKGNTKLYEALLN